MAPWSSFWDRNSFLHWVPALEAALASPYARGAVSGLGLLTLGAGFAELGGAFAARQRGPRSASPGSTIHVDPQ